MVPELSPHEEDCICEWCRPIVSVKDFERRFFPRDVEERRLAKESPEEAGKRIAKELFAQST
jgi:hypothetical protein